MTDLTLAQAQTIVTAALDAGRTRGFKPLAVVVVDARGSLKASLAADGTSIGRWKLAWGKANAAIQMGFSSRTLETFATSRPHFFAGLTTVIGEQGAIPVAGGVIIRDASGTLIGACGISGDTSDNDEAAAVAGIEAAGLVADCA